MPDNSAPDQKRGDQPLGQHVGRLAERKLRARARGEPNVWRGFGVFGVIGWSVAVPAVAGALLGMWLDRHYPGARSYTLALLAAGLVLGCWNAWQWMAKEERAMKKQQEDNHD